MLTATIEEVQTRLPELIQQVSTGEEIIVVSDGKPVAHIMAPPLPKGVPILGRGKGKLISYTEDDEHLKLFEEYMP